MSILRYFKPPPIALIILIFAIIIPNVTLSQAHNSINEYDEILAKVYKEDQGIRAELGRLMQSEEQIPMSFYLEMSAQDLKNQQVVKPILEKYLNKEITLSNESLLAIYLVIQHADYKLQKTYESFIEDIYRQEIISNIDYARFVDRLLVMQNKVQLVGCQSAMNAYTRDIFPYPLSISDSVRSELGMMQVKEELESMFKNEYAPMFIDQSEYVIFGHMLIADVELAYKGVENVEVIINEMDAILTNLNGFYAVKIKKGTLPIQMTIKYGGRKYECMLMIVEGTDWQQLDLRLDEIWSLND